MRPFTISAELPLVRRRGHLLPKLAHQRPNLPAAIPLHQPRRERKRTDNASQHYALEWLLEETNSRNFYDNGHGAASGIAYDLDSYRIKSDLRGATPLCIFDACSTAKGSLAASFGINSTTTQPLSYYQQLGTLQGHSSGTTTMFGTLEVAVFTIRTMVEHTRES